MLICCIATAVSKYQSVFEWVLE